MKRIKNKPEENYIHGLIHHLENVPMQMRYFRLREHFSIWMNVRCDFKWNKSIKNGALATSKRTMKSPVAIKIGYNQLPVTHIYT